MKRELILGLAWAGSMIALALCANFARELGYVDADTVTRGNTCIIGLWLVWYGNRMPKAVVPKACGRQARRVGGWAMVVSGLVYVGLWAFAPIPVARTVGGGAVLAGIAVMLGYCLSLRARAKSN